VTALVEIGRRLLAARDRRRGLGGRADAAPGELEQQAA
jgi:hypothetical protein